MSEDIKETLETIKECIETNDDNIESFIIDIQKWKELLDYITNLQEENERLQNIIDELEKYIGAEWYCFDNESVEFEVAKDILDKLQELKGSYK